MAAPIHNEFQPDMTQWFTQLGNQKRSEEFRIEDNQKNERLEILYQAIDLPYERPVVLEAQLLRDNAPEFQHILDKRGQELCAIRLVPKDPALPKLRNRGLTLNDCYRQWFCAQDLDATKYLAQILPHTDQPEWSAIFVVDEQGIWGEIIEGMHHQLSTGATTHPLITFHGSHSGEWEWSLQDSTVETLVGEMIDRLTISDASARSYLEQSLNAQFSHNRLLGYFEATVWPGGRIYFLDYNRLVPSLLTRVTTADHDTGQGVLLKGVGASPGVASGPVMIVNADHIDPAVFPTDAILVTDVTDVRFVPLMLKAAAVITNRGGILSHAAIVCRELKLPCIVNTKNAAEALQNSQHILVDADNGIVRTVE